MSGTGFRVPLGAIWRAELIRLKGSVLVWLPLLGIPLAGLSALLAGAAGTHDATGLLWWQGMYLTGMAAPLLGVFAAVAETRELRARFGGADTRPVSPKVIRVGRLVSVIAAVMMFHLLNFGVTWLATLPLGGGATRQILVVGGLAFLGAIGTTALGIVLARLVGLTWTVIILAGWQLAGTLSAEASWWWAFPPAWAVRLVLPELGLHANLVPLPSDSPLAGELPWLAVLLNVGFAGVVAVLAASVARRPGPTLRPGRQVSANGAAQRPGSSRLGSEYRSRVSGWQVIRTVHLVQRRSAVPVLVAVVTVLLALTAWLYPPTYIHGLVAFVFLPLGTAVLPMLTWRSLSPAWQVMVTENHRASAGLVGWHLMVVAMLCAVAGTAGLLAGAAVGPELLRCLIAMIVGGVLVTGALALVIRFSLGAGALFGVLWTVVSATLGGDVLAESWLWLLALPAWPETADSPIRIAVAVVVGLGLLMISLLAVVPALRWFERQG